jgi:hypothetical protein
VTQPIPNPALVTRGAARRLPRLALVLFCAAYLIPGVFGRDPWKNADLIAFGQMLALADGRASWWAPTLGGVTTGAALLPDWLGAGFISMMSPWLAPALAARIPFCLLLALTLLGVWRAAYHLARGEAALPLPLAFGGEAAPKDYARTIADSALLSLIATLGLLQLGHETTPELAQLAACSTLLWAVSAAAYKPRRSRLGIVVSLAFVAGCGAPMVAVCAGTLGALICRRSAGPLAGLAPTLLLGALLAGALAWPLNAWAWRGVDLSAALLVRQLLRLLPWFLWPAWPLAVWTLWRWRNHLAQPHLLLPALIFGLGLATCVATGGSDRALMIGLPGIAVLAAFALPTMRRSATAAIDWFSLFFFTLLGASIWLAYFSQTLGLDSLSAAIARRVGPDFILSADALSITLAVAASMAWLWLVKWRTQRLREALWTSLVLPAGGVALCWLLAMTLLLPALDHARSYRTTMTALAPLIARYECIAGPELTPVQVAALEFHGHWRVDARPLAGQGNCPVLLQIGKLSRRQTPPPGWREAARQRHLTDSGVDTVLVYRRTP